MKLVPKWMLWFVCIGIYVMVLGGVFYYNLFKWTFDEKLKQDVLERVRMKSPDLIQNLLKSPKALSFNELDVIDWLKSDKRIVDILYLNGNGTIRWHKLGQYLGMPFDEYEEKVGVPTDAIGQAYVSLSPKVRLIPKQPFYEIAIPLKAKGDVVIGILSLQVSREGAEKIIKSAMQKYIIGALGILFLLGLPLYVFMSTYVTSRINSLKDSVQSVSTKSFEMKFDSTKKDEIGNLANSINELLARVKYEINILSSKDMQKHVNEQSWWEAVLNAAVCDDSKVMVVDENNTILYANFNLGKDTVGAEKLHLLDVVDNQQQDVLRLISEALDNPRNVVEGDTIVKGQKTLVRVVQLSTDSNIKRTLILFVPQK
jgi:HAMP domain-containing protein